MICTLVSTRKVGSGKTIEEHQCSTFLQGIISFVYFSDSCDCSLLFTKSHVIDVIHVSKLCQACQYALFLLLATFVKAIFLLIWLATI